MTSTHQAKAIFKRGSQTYYFSSLFFPEPYRTSISTLYAFVRTADDFVDQVIPDRTGFYHFVELTWAVWNETEIPAKDGDELLPIIRDFVALAREVQINKALVEAFFASMELDLVKSSYETLDETVTYMYGSAEVIGIMIIRIFNIPAQAEPTGRLLGRAMQFINMIRDVAEDQKLKRQYLPLAEQRSAGLTELSVAGAQKQPEAFKKFIRAQLKQQAEWMDAARLGFVYLPRSLRIPVQTATDMYAWTGEKIYADPFIIWQRAVKPSRWRVMTRAIWLWCTLQ